MRERCSVTVLVAREKAREDVIDGINGIYVIGSRV